MAFWISQGISLVATIINLISVQCKNMKLILFTQITQNALLGVSYLLLGGTAGFFISMLGVLFLIVMYIYNKLNKKPQIPVVAIFVAISVTYSVITFKEFIDILPLIASLIYKFGLLSNKPPIFRATVLVNASCWIAYDISLLSINVISHSCLFVATIIGMIRSDGLFGIIKKKTEEPVQEIPEEE